MFYTNYVDLCNKRGLSPSAAAEAMGFKRSVITRWAKGANPRQATLQKIASFFEVTVEDLIGNADNKKDPATNRDEISFEQWMAIYESLSPAGREELDSYARYLQSKEAGQ